MKRDVTQLRQPVEPLPSRYRCWASKLIERLLTAKRSVAMLLFARMCTPMSFR